MKKLIGIFCGFLFLPLPVLSDPLVISASGRGGSEMAAIASAKNQAIKDSQLAGFLPKDGYRLGPINVVELKFVGAAYDARVEAELVKDLESKRILFVVSGEESHLPRLFALVQRVRVALAEKRLNNEPHIEVVDTVANGSLRINRATEIQRPGFDTELEQIVRKHQANVLYLLSASDENAPVFLITVPNDRNLSKKIRILRDSSSGNNLPLTKQVVDIVERDFAGQHQSYSSQSVVTVPASGLKVRKGQTVLVYAATDSEDGVQESTIVTQGKVTDISATKVRVLTEQPVPSSLGGKLRISPQSKRGIITESDW